MNGWQRGLWTIGGSLAIAAILTVLMIRGTDSFPQSGAPLPPTHHVLPVALSDSNIVDHLSNLELHGKLRKVGWQASVLSLTLQSQADGSERDLFEDMWRIVQFGFEETSNVKHVLVRIVTIDEKENEQLTMSMVAMRDDWNKLSLEVLDTLDLEETLRTYFKITDHRQRFGLNYQRI